jgi:hypothetical protein
MPPGSANHCCGWNYAVHHPAFWIMSAVVVGLLIFFCLFILANKNFESDRRRRRMFNKVLYARSAEKIRFLKSGKLIRFVMPYDNPNLVELLARDSDPRVAEAAIQSCGSMSSRRGDLLVDLTRNPNPRIASALLHLSEGSVDYACYERVVQSLVRHPDAEIRRHASEVDLDGWKLRREQLLERLRREAAERERLARAERERLAREAHEPRRCFYHGRVGCNCDSSPGYDPSSSGWA